MWHFFVGLEVDQVWSHLIESDVSIAEKVVRTVGVYALLLILLRITGKRGLAGLNSMDLVVIFLLSNVVQNAIIGNDNSLLGGAVGAVTLVAVNAAVNRLACKYAWADRLFMGSSVSVIEDGVGNTEVLQHYGVRRDELDHAVRLQGGDSIENVADGELTPTGQLVLTLKEAAQGATRADIDRILSRIGQLETRLSTAR